MLRNSLLRNAFLRFTPVLALFSLSACEGEATIPEDLGPTGTTTVNASSTTDFRYFSLSTGAEVTVTNPATDTNWDLALRRYEVRLNGGVAGSKGVTGTLLTDQSALPAATLLGYTPENQLTGFASIAAENIPSSSLFTTTDIAENTSSWFRAAGATLVANPGAAWKLRRADGGFALIRVAELTLNGNAMATFRLEYRLQPAGGTLGAVQSVTVTPGSPATPTHLSLTAGAAVATAGCTWDLAVTSALTFAVNTDATCPAGSFPLESTENFTALTTAADAPRYGRFISAMSGPIAYGITAAVKPPFLYNIDPVNANRLSPTFNVYLVRVGNSVYKVQFLSYYNPTGGESGYLTFRHARIQ